MPEFFTRAEVARILKISPRSVERYVKAGRLPAPLKLSDRTRRYRLTDINKYLQDAGLAGGVPDAPPVPLM